MVDAIINCYKNDITSACQYYTLHLAPHTTVRENTVTPYYRWGERGGESGSGR